MKNLILFIVLIAIAFSCYKYSTPGDYSFIGGTESYNEITENPFVYAWQQPISTFSIDVDGGSYANCRRYINSGYLPPIDAIRTEEFINYFQYNYGEPDDGLPFFHNAELAACPWTDGHKILRIGLKGHTISNTDRNGTNFVFLIDVSGSMSDKNKLELLKNCFIYFVQQKIDARDKVAIVTYAGSTQVVLEPTSGKDKDKIISKLQKLSTGGSTNGEGGIRKAYELAQNNFIRGGNNRIILATDGDFNVGISNQDELIKLIDEKRNTGIFLTVIGVGQGNIQEGTMEQLADHGNGNYEYIDNFEQGRKVFVYEFNAFYPVAKDVKIQVEFDSTVVKQYRLIGYENRTLTNEDFANDSTDAGDLGSDQDVTAMYEIILQENVGNYARLGKIAVRYKLPNESLSRYFDLEFHNTPNTFDEATENFRFAAGVTAFALLMRNSEYSGNATYDKAKLWIQKASTYNPYYYKSELVQLIDIAKTLKR